MKIDAQIRITEKGSGMNQVKIDTQLSDSREGVSLVRHLHRATGNSVCISFGGYNADFGVSETGEEKAYRGFRIPAGAL